METNNEQDLRRIAMIKTKLPQILKERLQNLLIQEGSSLYDFIQKCCLLKLKYDSHSYEFSKSETDTFHLAMSPILNLPKDYMNGFRKAMSHDFHCSKKDGDIEKVIAIRKGGFATLHTLSDSGRWTQSYDLEDVLFDLLTGGSQVLKKDVKSAMKAYETPIFSIFFRRLIQDIEEDVNLLLRNQSSQGYSSNSYGNRPLRKFHTGMDKFYMSPVSQGHIFNPDEDNTNPELDSVESSDSNDESDYSEDCISSEVRDLFGDEGYDGFDGFEDYNE